MKFNIEAFLNHKIFVPCFCLVLLVLFLISGLVSCKVSITFDNTKSGDNPSANEPAISDNTQSL